MEETAEGTKGQRDSRRKKTISRGPGVHSLKLVVMNPPPWSRAGCKNALLEASFARGGRKKKRQAVTDATCHRQNGAGGAYQCTQRRRRQRTEWPGRWCLARSRWLDGGWPRWTGSVQISSKRPNTGIQLGARRHKVKHNDVNLTSSGAKVFFQRTNFFFRK